MKKNKFASFLIAAMVVACMSVIGLGTVFAADTTCHIGDIYYATLQDAYSDAQEGDTIVIDSADAGALDVDMVVKIDVGNSGYDLKQITYDEDWICAETDGTVTSYAIHGLPAEEGGVIFNWDKAQIPPTATVTFKDANGHTFDGEEAEVISDPEDFAAKCTEDVDVTFTACYPDAEDPFITEKWSTTINKLGHEFAVDDDADAQAKWWDGKKYNSKGIPVVKNVTVSCVRGDLVDQDATVEFVEAIPSKTNPPTCSENGEVTYTFKVLYEGEYVKNVKATKPEDQAKDYILSITDESAPATGVHVVNEDKEPGIEYKAYLTTEKDGETVFVSAQDPEKTVTAKEEAAIEWVADPADSAYAQGYDDVLTYHITWTCLECGEIFADDPVEVEPASTATAFYLANDTLQKDLKAADHCTAYSIETGTFAPVKVVYAKKPNGAQKVKDFAIGSVDKPANEDYEPQHNSEGVEVDVVDPTHTTVGTKSFTCADCHQDVVVELPKVGDHKFKANSQKTVDPTCTDMGYTYQICELCEAAHLAPVGEDGKEVKGLPASFTTEGAVVSATTEALGHNYVVLNADHDAEWSEEYKDVEGNYATECTVKYECTRCRDKAQNVTYHSEAGTDDAFNKYSAISSTVAKAKDCTENDVVTFTIDGLKDLNTGKALTKAFTDEDVIGPHAYKVKAINFSADGKSANATIECANAKCKGEKSRVISATSTSKGVDEETGLTTYEASITDLNLKNAKIPAAEIDTTIPAGQEKKTVYDLTGADVEVPDYVDDAGYAAREDKDVVVTIGDVTIDPKFYEINWPDVTAPKLDAKLTVTATDYEKDGISATGTSEPVEFEVTKSIDDPVDAVKVLVNGKETTKDEFEFTYNGKANTLEAETKTEDAEISYLIDGEEVDEAEIKDVKDDEDSYAVQYVIRYEDGTIFTSDTYTFWIYRTTVKLIKADYSKVEGAADPAIEYNDEQVFGSDDLKLKFEKHSEKVGTYKLMFEYDNNNYVVLLPTAEDYLTLVIMTDEEAQALEEAKVEAAAAIEAAGKVNEIEYPAEAAQKVADAKAALEALVADDSASAADVRKGIEDLNNAVAAADKAKEEADAQKTEEQKQAVEAAAAAVKAADKVTDKDYTADSVAAVAAAKTAVEDAVKTGDTAKIEEATKALNDAVANAVKLKATKIKVKPTKKTIKADKLKKAKKTFKLKAKVNSKAKAKFKKVKGNKGIKVSKTGKVTVKKGLKKGTYKIKIKVTTKKTATYKAGKKNVTLKIKVK